MHKRKYLIRAFSKDNKVTYMGIVNVGLNADGVATHISDIDALKYIKEFASSHRHNFRDLDTEELLNVLDYVKVEVSQL